MSDNFFDEADIVEDNFFDEADVVESIEPEEIKEDKESPKMGKLEAAVTGLAQGATYGLSPILSGSIGAAAEIVEDIADLKGDTTDAKLRDQGFEVKDDYEGIEGLMQAYYDARDAKLAQEKQANEEHAGITTAANIAGAIPSTILTGGLGTAAKAGSAAKLLPSAAKFGAIEGAKAGALSGLGQSESKLIEDPLEVANDVATSTMMGGVLGGATGGLGKLFKGAGNAVKNTPVGKNVGIGYKAGKEGVDILDDKQVGNKISEITGEVKDVLSDNFKGSSKKELLQQADELGIKIDAKASIDEIVDEIKGSVHFGKKAKNELNQFIEDLGELKSPSNNPTLAKELDIGNLTPTDADELISTVGEKAFRESDDASTKYAKQLYGKLRELSNEAIGSSSLTERNKQLKNLFDAIESVGIKPKDIFSSQEIVQDKVLKKLQQKLTGSSLSGDDIDMQNLLKYLKRVDSDAAEDIVEKSDYASGLSKFVKQSEGEGSMSLRAIGGPIQRIVGKVGNVAGSLVGSTSKSAKSFIKDITPDKASQLNQKMIELYGDTAKPYVNQLNSAMQASDTKRNALLYSIMQQPAFRKMVEGIQGKEDALSKDDES